MKILLIGGTGVIGKSLQNELSSNDKIKIVVTSRSKGTDPLKKVEYVKINGLDDCFYDWLSDKHFDVIVDFLKCKDDVFLKRINCLSTRCSRYFFISSCRIFDKDSPVNESSKHLSETSSDRDFVMSNEYSLSKSFQEKTLMNIDNYVIIRPYITSGPNRLQLFCFEQNDWLRRFLFGKPVVVPLDVLSKKTTITSSRDVAKIIANVILDEKIINTSVNAVSDLYCTWKDVLDYYSASLKELTGIDFIPFYVEESKSLYRFRKKQKYQYVYDRMFDRVFDNKLAKNILGDNFKSPNAVIYESVKETLEEEKGKELFLLPIETAIQDRISNTFSIRKHFSCKKKYFEYLLARFMPLFIFRALKL